MPGESALNFSKQDVILVNATAATAGGALTVLTDFLETLQQQKSNFRYIVFVSPSVLSVAQKYNIIAVPISNRTWLARSIWDWHGIRAWCKKREIHPRLAVSFQNIAMNLPTRCAQIVYLHQSIPFAKGISWNPFVRTQRLFWFYRHVYPILIRISFSIWKPMVAVQTCWMKQAVCDHFRYRPEQVIVVPPDAKFQTVNGEEPDIHNSRAKYSFFYPSVPYDYKNHEVLFAALAKIKAENEKLFSHIQLALTVKPTDSAYAQILAGKAAKLGISSAIEWLGTISRAECFSHYRFANALTFPSLIETVGLPLVEAAAQGATILASDLPYSREVLDGYPGAVYLAPHNPSAWADAIVKYAQDSQKHPPMQVRKSGWATFVSTLEALAAGAH